MQAFVKVTETHSISNWHLDSNNFLSILILHFYPVDIIALV